MSINSSSSGLMKKIGTFSGGGANSQSGTISIADIYPNYSKLTASNFRCLMTSVSASGDIGDHGHGSTGGASISAYNPSTGVVTWYYSPNYYDWAGTGISGVSGEGFLVYP